MAGHWEHQELSPPSVKLGGRTAQKEDTDHNAQCDKELPQAGLPCRAPGVGVGAGGGSSVGNVTFLRKYLK